MITLKKYYSGSHWRKLRDGILSNFDVTCSICGRRRWTLYKVNTKKHKKGDRRRLLRFNLHHKTYKNLGGEHPKDLLPVCQHCHDLCHSIEKAARLNHNVYGPIYQLLLDTTSWEYEKRIQE